MSRPSPRLTSREFDREIDRTCAAERSLVLRYRQVLAPFLKTGLGVSLPEGLLESVSLGEGARVISGLRYRGVEIRLLDETSLMASRTFKSIDACLSVALCLQDGRTPIVFESGGNAGAALALYASRAGLRNTAVVPARNLGALPARAFTDPASTVVAVEDASAVKETALTLARAQGSRRIPDLRWRYAAGMFRGCHIAEYMLREGRVDWISQAVSAGFGPIGIFRLLGRLDAESARVPRLLAVQQEENAPYHDRLNGARAEGRSDDLLIPSMYDCDPYSYGAFDEFASLIRAGGRVVTISRAEFRAFAQGAGAQAVEDLKRLGLWGRRPTDPAGRAGLAGVFKAVDAGHIRRGERVLHAMTSGAYPGAGGATASTSVRSARDAQRCLAAA